MSTSSSSAAEKNSFLTLLRKTFVGFLILLLFFIFFYLGHRENNVYILKTLELRGSVNEGDLLFKMNCVGCHGITARGLVGPDLHSITERLNDKEIIKQVIEGKTPPHA